MGAGNSDSNRRNRDGFEQGHRRRLGGETKTSISLVWWTPKKGKPRFKRVSGKYRRTPVVRGYLAWSIALGSVIVVDHH